MPNHAACLSGVCDDASLTCTKPAGISRPAIDLSSNKQPLAMMQLQEQHQLALQPAPESAQTSSDPGMSCPSGQEACPLKKTQGGVTSTSFGCFDTFTHVNQCGGCVVAVGETGLEPKSSTSVGVDCLTLPGVAGAACVEARCRVFSCKPSFEFDPRTGTCHPKKYA